MTRQHLSAVAPEPTCNEPLRLYGFAIACDRPRGHLPPNEHASTVHWSAPLVRVNESKRPPRNDLAVIRENVRRYRVEELGVSESEA